MAVPHQNFKVVECIAPQAIKDDGSWTTAEVDTNGFDAATLIVHVGATDIAFAALAVTESDTTGSNHANVTGLIWGTSANIDGSTSALPAAGDDNTFQRADIDLRGRKRFLDLTATAGDGTAGTYASAVWLLWRSEEGFDSVADYGCNELLRV